MANHKSAKKRHKQSLIRAARNKATKTRVKNLVKDLNTSIVAGNKEEAMQKLPNTISVLAKAAKTTIHWKKMARKTSRLAKAVNKISA